MLARANPLRSLGLRPYRGARAAVRCGAWGVTTRGAREPTRVRCMWGARTPAHPRTRARTHAVPPPYYLMSFARSPVPRAQYTFEAYEAEFNKVYETAELRAHRRAAFSANMDKIKTHNTQTPPSSWTMGVNKFADMSQKEFGEFTRGRNKALASTQQELSAQEKAVWAEESKDHVRILDPPRALPSPTLLALFLLPLSFHFPSPSPPSPLALSLLPAVPVCPTACSLEAK